MLTQLSRIVKSFLIALSHVILFNMFRNQPTYMDTFLISFSLLMTSVLFQMSSSLNSFQTMLCCWVSLILSVLLYPCLKCYLFEVSQDKNGQFDLDKCSFVKFDSNTSSVLYEQYTSDLNDLLDKQAPKVSHTFIKGLLNGSQILI